MLMNLANYRTLIDSVICLILVLCCCLIQPADADETVESSGDTNVAEITPRAEFDATRILKIAYYIDSVPIAETTTQLKPFTNRASVRVGARLSRYAIQQSIKTLYATQQYSQIQVYAQEMPDGIILTYQLTSFERIKAIKLSGIPDNDEFGQTIEDAMKSKVGGSMSH